MNEDFKSAFVSAEQKFLIDRESGYFSALAFASNPVAFLTDYRAELQADGFDEQTICQQAMAMIGELEEVICNEDIEVSDKRVAAMIKAEYGSESWAMETFSLLKFAGYTKAEALAWVIMNDPELTNEELLKERTLHFFIKKVYDDI